MNHKYVQKEKLAISEIHIVEDSILQPHKIGLQTYQIKFVFKVKVVCLSKQLVKEYTKILKLTILVALMEFLNLLTNSKNKNIIRDF